MTAGLVWSDSADFSITVPALTGFQNAILSMPGGLCPLATVTRARVAWLVAAVMSISPAVDPIDVGTFSLSTSGGHNDFPWTLDPSKTLAVGQQFTGAVLAPNAGGRDPNLGGDFDINGTTVFSYSMSGSIAAALWYDDQTAGSVPATTFNSPSQRVSPTAGANTGTGSGSFTTDLARHAPTWAAEGVFAGFAGHQSGSASTPVLDPSWTTIVSRTNGSFYAALAWVPGPYSDPQTFTWSLGGNSSVDWGLLDAGEMLYDRDLPVTVTARRTFAAMIGD